MTEDEALAIYNKMVYRNCATVHIAKSVVVCDVCNGAGYTSKEELTDYHKREYDVFHYACKKCNGEGRLTREHHSVSFQMRKEGVEKLVPWSKDPISKPEHESFDLVLTPSKR